MFWNKKLKAEIKEKNEDILYLKKQVSELSAQIIDFQVIKEQYPKVLTELNATKTKVREQNEADLFFVSAQIQKKLLDGEPKENVRDLLDRQNYYQQLVQQMGQSPYGFFGLGNSGLSNLY